MWKVSRTLLLLPLLVYGVNSKLADDKILLLIVAASAMNLVVAFISRFRNGQLLKNTPLDSLPGLVIWMTATAALWMLLCICPMPALPVDRNASICVFVVFAFTNAVVPLSKKRGSLPGSGAQPTIFKSSQRS